MSTVVHHPTLVKMHINSFSRHSNRAGAPLPFIPRRASHRSVNTPPSMFSDSQVEPPSQVTLDPHPIPGAVETDVDKTEELSSSSSESLLQFDTQRTKRLRSARPLQLHPSEQSTPGNIAALKSSRRSGAAPPEPTSDNETPRSSTREITSSRSAKRHSNLRIDLDCLNHPHPPSSDVFSVDPQRRRKRSGEPLKSSLKIKTPVGRGDLSAVTTLPGTKSEPTTPTHARSKSVQFAEQLERVKLFLAEQKPLAVSRDGSPTDDTSGTESDFPSFIYGSSDEENKKKNLIMEVVNMPKSRPLQVDVMLEDVSLSQEATIHGHLKVRNLAFQKWLAVRFTFDWWQTTSEVAAKYEESLDAGAFDRFSFSIRIHDLLSRIEERTLLMAIRYSVNGREIWDNNGGKNYELRFSVPTFQPNEPLLKENPEVGGMVDLLDKVAKAKMEAVGPPPSSSGPITTLPSSDAEAFSFNSATPLSSRYDFSASLKNPWKSSDYPLSPTPILHKRTSTHPSTSSSVIPWPRKRSSYTIGKEKKPYIAQLSRGSPRIDDDDDDTVSAPMIQDQDVDVVEDDQISVRSLHRHSGREGRRKGYFDAGSPQMSLVMTPPSLPVSTLSSDVSIQRYNSFPPTSTSSNVAGISCLPPPLIARGSSEDSTPSDTSCSSDLQTSLQSYPPSPVSSITGSSSENALEVKPNSDMTSFLNKFCFYTGPEPSDDILQRSHSASSVEEFLASSPNQQGSPMLTKYRTFISDRQSPSFRSRSSSYDDVATLSGTSTPTPGSTSFSKAALAL